MSILYKEGAVGYRGVDAETWSPLLAFAGLSFEMLYSVQVTERRAKRHLQNKLGG